MVDREKVIKAIDICLGHGKCVDCGYHIKGGYYSTMDCRKPMMRDALKLLNEQEAKWIEYPECLQYDGALDDSYIACSACGHVFNIMDNCTEEFDYCPHCGAKMNGSE